MVWTGLDYYVPGNYALSELWHQDKAMTFHLSPLNVCVVQDTDSQSDLHSMMFVWNPVSRNQIMAIIQSRATLSQHKLALTSKSDYDLWIYDLYTMKDTPSHDALQYDVIVNDIAQAVTRL